MRGMRGHEASSQDHVEAAKGTVLCTDQEGMEQMAYDHFVQILEIVEEKDYLINFAELDLTTKDLSDLEEAVMQDEVWEVVKSLLADRAAGPDGFTAQFYEVGWDIIKVDVVEAIQQFFYGDNQSFELLKEVLIILLPNREGVVDIGDYRPISLLYSLRINYVDWWVTTKVHS
jgi:hypothetical protein